MDTPTDGGRAEGLAGGEQLRRNTVVRQQINNTCAATVGIEPVNFAFITKNGVPQDKPNPVGHNHRNRPG